MIELVNDLRDAINKNLSSQTAGVLLEYLREAEKNKAKLVQLEGRVKFLTKTNMDLNDRVNEQNRVEILAREIEEKIETVEKAQMELDKNILIIKLKEADKRANEIKDLVRILFQNQEISAFRFGYMPVSCKDGNNDDYVEQHPYKEITTINKQKSGA